MIFFDKSVNVHCARCSCLFLTRFVLLESFVCELLIAAAAGLKAQPILLGSSRSFFYMRKCKCKLRNQLRSAGRSTHLISEVVFGLSKSAAMRLKPCGIKRKWTKGVFCSLNLWSTQAFVPGGLQPLDWLPLAKSTHAHVSRQVMPWLDSNLILPESSL